MTPEIPTLAHLRELGAELGAQLDARQLTIALAESCTGGLIASILTDIAGSSRYVMGGVVSYSNFAKMHVLGVQAQTLQTYGAVSPETAKEMANGVRALLHTDLALSVTGIAGPGGGTPEKPVGLVYLHLAAADADWGEMHIWPHDRVGNKRASVAAALRLALRYLQTRNESVPTQERDDSVRQDAPDTPPAAQARALLVEAAWRAGQWRPQALWLEGQRKLVAGVGRQHRRPDGAWVMTVELTDGGRAELLADEGSGVWQLRRYWPAPRYA